MQHQQCEDDEQHHRYSGGDRTLALAALGNRTRNHHVIAGRHAGLESLQFGPELRRHGRALHAIDDVALHGDGEVAVLAPDDARLPGKLTARNLRQRDRSTTRGRQVGAGQVGDRIALLDWLSQHDVDQAVALAVLPDRGA